MQAEGGGLSADYLARFGGIGRLYGAAALPKLRAAHVCVIGVGGVEEMNAVFDNVDCRTGQGSAPK